MANYNVDISIAIKNTNKLTAFNKQLEKTQLETVVRIDGTVVNRSEETINKEISTGEIEVAIKNCFTVIRHGTMKTIDDVI